MLALYRSGRHAEALRTYQQLRTTLVDELGLDPSPSLQRLQERILLHDPSLLPQPEQPAPDASQRNPYKGLRSFTEADAPDFFGRDALVERLIRALETGSHLVALVGPSGSGKSSAIAAGLIPRLREGAIPGSDRWVIAQMVPGTNPLAEVEAVVAAAAGVPTGLATLLDVEAAPDGASMPLRMMPEGSRVLLVIDQFEELFTITDEVARRRFLDCDRPRGVRAGHADHGAALAAGGLLRSAAPPSRVCQGLHPGRRERAPDDRERARGGRRRPR